MRFNRLFFWLFYRLGTPPWEGHPLPERLLELIEGPGALPPGTALDAGCGTGDTSIYLAQHGWDATAFDFVHVALNRARAKAASAGVSIRVMQGDVTRVTALCQMRHAMRMCDLSARSPRLRPPCCSQAFRRRNAVDRAGSAGRKLSAFRSRLGPPWALEGSGCVAPTR